MDAPKATTSAPMTAVRVDDGPEPAPGRETTMKAIVQDRYGPPDVLEIRPIVQPTVKDNQVLVKVHATPVEQALADTLATYRSAASGSQPQPSHPSPA